LPRSKLRRERRTGLLRHRSHRLVPPLRLLRRSHITQREGGRFALPAADQIRTRHQLEDCKSAGLDDPAATTAYRRRSHRIDEPCRFWHKADIMIALTNVRF